MWTTRLITTVAGLAIGAGLTACSGSSEGGSRPAGRSTTAATTAAGTAEATPAGATAAAAPTAGEPGTASYVDLLQPKSTAAAGKLAAAKILGKPEEGESSVAWRLERYQPEVGQLVLSWAAGSNGSTCLLDKGIRVVETSASVTISAIAWIPPNVRINCTLEKQVHTGYLDLKAPLGDRQLIHAPVDQGWSTVPELPARP